MLAAAATAEAEPLARHIQTSVDDSQDRRVRSFVGLESDDVRHPLDAQNTRLLRRLPGLDFVAKSLMGIYTKLLWQLLMKEERTLAMLFSLIQSILDQELLKVISNMLDGIYPRINSQSYSSAPWLMTSQVSHRQEHYWGLYCS